MTIYNLDDQNYWSKSFIQWLQRAQCEVFGGLIIKQVLQNFDL